MRGARALSVPSSPATRPSCFLCPTGSEARKVPADFDRCNFDLETGGGGGGGGGIFFLVAATIASREDGPRVSVVSKLVLLILTQKGVGVLEVLRPEVVSVVISRADSSILVWFTSLKLELEFEGPSSAEDSRSCKRSADEAANAVILSPEIRLSFLPLAS